MRLYAWYCHSWYVGRCEIGFDLRRWAIGGYHRTGESALYFGPVIIAHDRSLPAW